jgi:catechol 2,3-dioxygenase-like lactoylglutathione lyase family enzyme
MVHQLGVVEIGVHDMGLARQFYCDLLGFSIESEEHLPDFLILEHLWPKIVLFLTRDSTKIDYPNQAQTLLAFRVDDLDGLKERLVAEGVPILQDELKDSGLGRFIAVRDPSGNVHELFQPRED